LKKLDLETLKKETIANIELWEKKIPELEAAAAEAKETIKKNESNKEELINKALLENDLQAKEELDRENKITSECRFLVENLQTGLKKAASNVEKFKNKLADIERYELISQLEKEIAEGNDLFKKFAGKVDELHLIWKDAIKHHSNIRDLCGKCNVPTPWFFPDRSLFYLLTEKLSDCIADEELLPTYERQKNLSDSFNFIKHIGVPAKPKLDEEAI
jgi:hypothetical protein